MWRSVEVTGEPPSRLSRWMLCSSSSRCMGSRPRGPLRQAEEPRWHRDAPEPDRARRGVALGALCRSYRPGRWVALLCEAVRRRVRSRDALSAPQPGDAESLARPTGTTRLFHVEQPRRHTALCRLPNQLAGYPGGLPVPMPHAHDGAPCRRCRRSALPCWHSRFHVEHRRSGLGRGVRQFARRVPDSPMMAALQ